MVYRFCLPLTLSILALGCSPTPLPSREESIASELPLGEQFDPTECGDLRVEASWVGDRPTIEPFTEVSLSPQAGWVHRSVPNPHAPVIAPSGAVSRMVVFLRSVDLARSKPWSIPEPKIVLNDTGIEIVPSEVGFVRRGSEIEIETTSTKLQSVRSRGANFFTLMFPPNASSLRRRFAKDGFAELSSATGMFGTRAHLLVLPHPYCGTTDANGSVLLNQIPEGDYELVCWMPNFHVERIERDPETGMQVRQFYAAPMERTIQIRIERNRTVPVRLAVSLADFGSPKAEKPNP